MELVKIKDLNKFFDKEVIIHGFIENIRNLQYVIFIILKDETGKIQVTIEKEDENNKDLVKLFDNLMTESTIKVKGKVLENSKVKLNGMEIIPNDIVVTSENKEELPFNYKDLNNVNIDTRLDYRYIDLRNEKNKLIIQIRSSLIRYLRDYLINKNFTEINTPKLIGAASESGSEVFEVKYFDRKAYLAQSPQFYKQMAMAAGFGSIFEVSSVFRAENSNTSRHATEFTSFDVETSYIDSYHDIMNLESEMIKYAFNKLDIEYKDKLKDIFNVEIKIPEDIPKLTLSEVYEKLEEKYNYKVDDSEKTDLTREAEKLLGKLALDLYKSDFIFVTDYPADKRAFYHMRDENNILLGYDLYFRGVEITTGAQREHRFEEVVKNAKEKNLEEDVKFYLEFFKHGCPPHGGFGLGIDRVIMILLNIDSVKEVQFLFRGPNRLTP